MQLLQPSPSSHVFQPNGDFSRFHHSPTTVSTVMCHAVTDAPPGSQHDIQVDSARLASLPPRLPAATSQPLCLPCHFPADRRDSHRFYNMAATCPDRIYSWQNQPVCTTPATKSQPGKFRQPYRPSADPLFRPPAPCRSRVKRRTGWRPKLPEALCAHHSPRHSLMV